MMSVCNFVYPTVHNSPRGAASMDIADTEWWNVTTSAGGGSITTQKLAISEKKNEPLEKQLHNALPEIMSQMK